MTWLDDPELESAMRLHRVRNGLLRTAIIWTPLFLAALAGFIFYAIDSATGAQHGGSWVLVVILGIIAFLFGYQSIQTIIDLFGQPIEATGFIQRRWARRDSFIFQTQYIRLDKHILRGDPLLLLEVKQADYVRILFYPHAGIVIEVEQLTPPKGLRPEIDRRQR